MSIKIITDSTSYIPENLMKQYDIDIVSLSVVFKDDVYREVDLGNDRFYKMLDEYDRIPSSSQPSVEELYNLYEKNISEGNDIVGVFLSSDMSGTYSTALIVKNMILENYPNAKIEIIDSRSNCMQLGYAVIAGAKVAKEGLGIEDVVKAINANIKRSQFIFLPDTLEYLKKGGRIGAAKALLGSLLQIKPLLTVREGKTHIISKIRTKKKAIETMKDLLMNNINVYGLGDIIVHHINCEKEAKELAKAIGEKLGIAVNICPIGPVIGTHVGPGAIGIAYYTDKELILNDK